VVARLVVTFLLPLSPPPPALAPSPKKTPKLWSPNPSPSPIASSFATRWALSLTGAGASVCCTTSRRPLASRPFICSSMEEAGESSQAAQERRKDDDWTADDGIRFTLAEDPRWALSLTGAGASVCCTTSRRPLASRPFICSKNSCLRLDRRRWHSIHFGRGPPGRLSRHWPQGPTYEQAGILFSFPGQPGRIRLLPPYRTRFPCG
jgi:hypothetical protein